MSEIEGMDRKLEKKRGITRKNIWYFLFAGLMLAVVLIIIFIFGGEVIRGFTFALLMGILIGTYSSLFTASPIAYDMLGGDRKLKGVPVKSVKQVQKKKKK
jgi:preprotein translocase subunit SecF